MRNLKTLALCASLLVLGLPAYAQTVHKHNSMPLLTEMPRNVHAPHMLGGTTVTPDEQAAPTYDQVKAAFTKMVGGITAAINGPELTKAFSDLQAQIDGLAKIQQEYVTAKGDPKTTQSQLDAIVAKYAAAVQSIQGLYSALQNEEQEMVQAANFGITALHKTDDAKASADADVKALTDSLQTLMDSKFDTVLGNAEKAVGPVVKATESAVQARLPAIVNEELNRAVSNQLESAAAQ
jgi:hypothetical protein